jgi:MFS family permease
MKILPFNISELKNIFNSLQSKNYRIYFAGQGISLIGTWMERIALSWLVYRLTGKVFLLGLVGFTSQIPSFILTPFTGVITDRFNRLNIMKTTQTAFMLQALAMTLLVLFNVVQVWHIIALSIVSGIIAAFDAPARQSLVIDLIDNPAHLGNAIALNSAIFNGARLIGPAIAGIVIAAVGEGICFLFNTLSFLAVIIALMFIRVKKRQRTLRNGHFRESFVEGFRYTFHSLPIRTLILLLASLSLAGLPFIVLLPAYAKEILNGGSQILGYLMSALGAGALLAALYMAARKSVLGLGRIISINILVLAIAIGLAAISRQLTFSLIVCFFGGLAMILLLSSVNTLLQTITDEDKRGRVMSFYAMALMGTTPIGNLIAGSLASAFGIPDALLLFAAITILTAIWFRIHLPGLRKVIRPIYVTKGILPGLPRDII